LRIASFPERRNQRIAGKTLCYDLIAILDRAPLPNRPRVRQTVPNIIIFRRVFVDISSRRWTCQLPVKCKCRQAFLKGWTKKWKRRWSAKKQAGKLPKSISTTHLLRPRIVLAAIGLSKFAIVRIAFWLV